MRNKIFFLALALVLLVSITGAAKEMADIKIGFIVKNLVNPFFVTMKAGAEAAGAKYGAAVSVYAPVRPDDVEEQVRIMEDLINQKIDAIVVVPSDSVAIIPGIERANAAKVPVFVANTRAFGGEFVAFAGIDHIETATIIGTYLVGEVLQGKGNIVILEGVPGAQTAIDRLTGFKGVLEKHPKAKLLETRTAMYNRVEAMRVMEDYLTKYPQIDGVLAANDEMALGAVEAIKAAGRLGEIRIVGIDAIPDALRSVKDGFLTATINSDPYSQAYVPVEAAIKYIAYGEIPPKELKVELEDAVVHRDNVDQFLK